MTFNHTQLLTLITKTSGAKTINYIATTSISTKINSSIAPATISEDSSIATAEKLAGNDNVADSTASTFRTIFGCCITTSSTIGDYYFDKTSMATTAIYDIAPCTTIDVD